MVENSLQKHRGANGDLAIFARSFVNGRLAGFEKDMKICLTPMPAIDRSGATHAYFPALSSCLATLEYFSALRIGKTQATWEQVAEWSHEFMTQPDYKRESIRVLFLAFRHSVAHRGIASGVWIDKASGPGKGRRITWKVHADAKHPAFEIRDEKGILKRDPPWPCEYSHRVHIHLKSLWVDIREGAHQYREALCSDEKLLDRFRLSMNVLYPKV